jgi:hypothetical protein
VDCHACRAGLAMTTCVYPRATYTCRSGLPEIRTFSPTILNHGWTRMNTNRKRNGTGLPNSCVVHLSVARLPVSKTTSLVFVFIRVHPWLTELFEVRAPLTGSGRYLLLPELKNAPDM